MVGGSSIRAEDFSSALLELGFSYKPSDTVRIAIDIVKTHCTANSYDVGLLEPLMTDEPGEQTGLGHLGAAIYMGECGDKTEKDLKVAKYLILAAAVSSVLHEDIFAATAKFFTVPETAPDIDRLTGYPLSQFEEWRNFKVPKTFDEKVAMIKNIYTTGAIVLLPDGTIAPYEKQEDRQAVYYPKNYGYYDVLSGTILYYTDDWDARINAFKEIREASWDNPAYAPRFVNHLIGATLTHIDQILTKDNNADIQRENNILRCLYDNKKSDDDKLYPCFDLK